MATEFELRELSKELYKTYKSEHDAFEEGFLENLDKICDEYKNQYEAYDKNEEKKTDLKNLINSRYSDNFNKYFKYFSFGITDGKIPKKSDLCISEVTFDNFIDKPPTRLRDASRDCYVISLGDKTWYEFKKRIKKKQQVRTENEEAETQNLKIAGTTIIDQQFIEDINKTKDFSMAEFYISKQDKNGQWLGLIRGWDIRRKIYDELKNVVENCFEKERTNKVSIILHGDGGSGKSTQLRKTALELSSSNKFKVLWLNNFEEFINGNKKDNDVSGWDIIKSNPFQNYILFIEDLYRELGSNVKENYANINIFKKFLKSTQSVKNVRLVIGDRYMYVELVREYLYNDNNQFLLDSDENSYIIEQIVLKVPEWQLIVEQKEFSDKLESAPLFMLLFIIAKVSESKNFKNIDLSEPHKAFQNIIKSDLEFIANEHIGLAKAIYFWSCIYSEHKIPISYETFLEIADHYNGKDTAEISDLYKRWNADDEIFDKLKLYISKNEKEQFQFNHDILADLGLSKTNIYNWGKFGTKIKLKLLKIITNKGDDYSASIFLATMLSKENRVFKDVQEKLYFIKKLINNKNKNWHYIYQFINLHPDNETLIEFANLLWIKKIDSFIFWNRYFKQIKEDKIVNSHISDVLNINTLKKFDPKFIHLVLKYTNKEIRKKIIKNILKYKKIKKIHPLIIKDCLEFKHPDTHKLLGDLFSKKFGDLHYSYPNETFADEVLQDENWQKFDSEIIVSCTFDAEKDIRDQFAKSILSKDSFEKIEDSIVVRSFKIVKGKIKQDFINKVLMSDLWRSFKNKTIVELCFKHSVDNVKKHFANKILQNRMWEDLSDFFVYECLEYVVDEAKQRFALIYLKKDLFFSQHPNVLKTCLKSFEGCEKLPPLINKTIRNIISNPSRMSYLGYIAIFRINFESHPLWKKKTNLIINNWDKYLKKSYLINDVLYSYRNQPQKIQKICLEILHKTNDITQLPKVDFWFIKTALGHPNLKQEAKQTALELLNSKNILISKKIIKIASQIVENNIYPEWET